MLAAAQVAGTEADPHCPQHKQASLGCTTLPQGISQYSTPTQLADASTGPSLQHPYIQYQQSPGHLHGVAELQTAAAPSQATLDPFGHCQVWLLCCSCRSLLLPEQAQQDSRAVPAVQSVQQHLQPASQQSRSLRILHVLCWVASPLILYISRSRALPSSTRRQPKRVMLKSLCT